MSARHDSDDMFTKDSHKTYQKCLVANAARKNSLMKKTMGIETQRRLAKSVMGREERQLREQLKSMKIEQSKVHSIREKKHTSKSTLKKDPTLRHAQSQEVIDPYPITFPGSAVTRQRSMTMVTRNRDLQNAGLRYAARRGRRVSKEFEDLNVNTATGKLAIPAHLLLHPGYRSGSSSGGSMSPRLSSSRSSLESAESDPTWPGNPEAIHSVRRPRKSVEQQEREKVYRLATAERT